MSNRLDTIAPSLALKLVALSKEDQRAVALSACQIVADDLKINNPIIALAVDGLSQGIALPTHVRRDLDTIAAEYDDSYFANQDEGKSADALIHFSKARLFSALSFAGIEDAQIGSIEAIYESAMAVDNQTLFLDKVEIIVAGLR